MMIDLTDREICLVIQSVEGMDWSYCDEGGTAESVVKKCRQAAAKIVAATKKSE
jgi:hypothetical protein